MKFRTLGRSAPAGEFRLWRVAARRIGTVIDHDVHEIILHRAFAASTARFAHAPGAVRACATAQPVCGHKD
jgi:hypothetical protein